MQIQDFKTPYEPTWCPGCGNFGLFMALKQAIVELGIEQHQIAFVFGIGCSGNTNSFIKGYTFHSLHGRTLPIAQGIKLANHKLHVIAMGGDGDGFGIGLGHFIHACRRNIDITYITHDNQIYGLTTGQYSPTSEKGMISKTTPFGAIEEPLNPVAMAISAEASFIARGFAGDVPHLKDLFKEALQHRGFSHVDVFQPCVTFNKHNTYQWYQKRVYKLDQSHKTTDRDAAWLKSQEGWDKLPIGIFYKQQRKLYEDELPVIKQKPLIEVERIKSPGKTLLKKFV